MVFRSKKEGPAVDRDTELALEFWHPDSLREVFNKEAEEFKEARDSGTRYEKGLFLEKLWSSIDYLLEQGRVALEKKGGKSIATNPEFLEELEKLFELVHHIKHPSVEDKIVLASELINFAKRAEIDLNELSPDLIDEYAAKNEEIALHELQRIKSEAPPFWVQRKPGFSPGLDSEKVPPFTARSILEDYRRSAQKRVKPERRQEESDIPIDYSLG